MVIKWNLLEGYQGLRELAESSDEAWNAARNQEIAGGLSNRAFSHGSVGWESGIQMPAALVSPVASLLGL